MNFWIQVYNLGVDSKTHKSSAKMEYDIINQRTKASVLHIVDTTENDANPGEQITLQRGVELAKFEPGTYQLTITIRDSISSQTIAPTAQFMVQ